jgi:hypothetical protein
MNMHEYGYASTYYIHILYGYEHEYTHAYSYKTLFEYSYSHVWVSGFVRFNEERRGFRPCRADLAISCFFPGCSDALLRTQSKTAFGTYNSCFRKIVVKAKALELLQLCWG